MLVIVVMFFSLGRLAFHLRRLRLSGFTLPRRLVLRRLGDLPLFFIRLRISLLLLFMRRSMALKQVEPFDVDKHRAIIRSARRLKNADHLEPLVLVALRADAVRRVDLVG